MKTNLHELYHEQIKDLYSADKQQLEILQEMKLAARNEDLIDKFESLIKAHQKHGSRLRQICESHSINPGGEKCEAMEGLVKEARHHMGETLEGPVKDAVMIASANRFEHYEIAGYGVAKAFAKALDLSADASLLDECLDEASNFDDELSKIATGGWFGSGVNEAAIAH
ncbi:DUF892 family protein [Verrucomicrobiaceae bacterium 227]